RAPARAVGRRPFVREGGDPMVRPFMLAWMAGLVLLAGCGGEKEEAASNAVSPPANKAAAPAKSDVSVVVISPALTSVFHQELVKGAQEAAEKRGWQFSHLEPDK